LAAFALLARAEGIVPALESAHALAHVAKIAPLLPPEKIILLNLSGRGDKDVDAVAGLGPGVAAGEQEGTRNE
jgi:tryptophan synthase beta subunit